MCKLDNCCIHFVFNWDDLFARGCGGAQIEILVYHFRPAIFKWKLGLQARERSGKVKQSIIQTLNGGAVDFIQCVCFLRAQVGVYGPQLGPIEVVFNVRVHVRKTKTSNNDKVQQTASNRHVLE